VTRHELIDTRTWDRPVLPGFVRSIKGTADDSGWDHIYQLTYFYGFFVAGLVYWTLHTAFPVPRQTGYSPFVLAEHVRMLEEEDREHRAVDSPESVDVVPAKLEI
jgi:nucleobase:cation symporter-1, NCS1 family